jgi:hypothetical protein
LVPRLLPHIEPEPPPGYVAFVASHLEPLRRDAERVTGDERGADRLYPEVLTDVAARWPWFELLRRRLRRPRAAESFLHRAFERRSQQWYARRAWPVEVEVRPVVVWSSEAGPRRAPGPPSGSPSDPPSDPPRTGRLDLRRDPPSARSSAALRLAPVVAGAPRAPFSPAAEAAVAWWHAYAAYRRRVTVAALTAAVVVLTILTRLVR